MTARGVILGTAAYMSPEQAKGRPADTRSDVWALGVVLYEMLAGRRPFRGDDVTDTLAAVLRAEPAWTELPAETPAGLQRLIRRCLQKDARRRWQHIGDVRLELGEIDQEEHDRPKVESAPRRRMTIAALVSSGASPSVADRRPRHGCPTQTTASQRPLAIRDSQQEAAWAHAAPTWPSKEPTRPKQAYFLWSRRRRSTGNRSALPAITREHPLRLAK